MNLQQMNSTQIEQRIDEVLAQLEKLLDDGVEIITDEFMADGEIHEQEGKGYIASEAKTASAKEYDAKVSRGQAEKEKAYQKALGWATRLKAKKLLAELDACRSIYSQRKQTENHL